MKNLFSKELGFIQEVSKLQLKDINLAGIIFSAIIVIVSLISNNTTFIPLIASLLTMIFCLILLVGVVILTKSTGGDYKKLVVIQLLLLFIQLLLITLFPGAVIWLKAFISLYIAYNFLISIANITLSLE